MNTVALLLLEAEITDELVSRARQACVVNGQTEPTEPAHFRVFLAMLVAELQEKSPGSAQLQRLQHYNRRLIQLDVGLSEPPSRWPSRATTSMIAAA